MPLEGVILTVKATFGNDASADDVLCRALTPPEQAAVAAAVANLKVWPLPMAFDEHMYHGAEGLRVWKFHRGESRNMRLTAGCSV